MRRFLVPAFVLIAASAAMASEWETTHMMVASLTFFRGKVKAFESAPLRVTTGLNAKAKSVPVRFSIPLSGLEPGRYTCQVNLLQPGVEKFAVWQSPMVVLP